MGSLRAVSVGRKLGIGSSFKLRNAESLSSLRGFSSSSVLSQRTDNGQKSHSETKNSKNYVALGLGLSALGLATWEYFEQNSKVYALKSRKVNK